MRRPPGHRAPPLWPGTRLHANPDPRPQRPAFPPRHFDRSGRQPAPRSSFRPEQAPARPPSSFRPERAPARVVEKSVPARPLLTHCIGQRSVSGQISPLREAFGKLKAGSAVRSGRNDEAAMRFVFSLTPANSFPICTSVNARSAPAVDRRRAGVHAHLPPSDPARGRIRQNFLDELFLLHSRIAFSQRFCGIRAIRGPAKRKKTSKYRPVCLIRHRARKSGGKLRKNDGFGEENT